MSQTESTSRTPPPTAQLHLTATLWAALGLGVFLAAAGSMSWWGVAYEQRWLPALTLQSLWMGEGWGVDLFTLRNVTSSPLMILAGRPLMALLPSAPLVLWSLSILGVGMLGYGALVSVWTRSQSVNAAVSVWFLTLWVTSSLVLGSLGMGWSLALGCLGLGAALVECRWEKLGWLVLGFSILGRAEMGFGVLGTLVWRLQARDRTDSRAAWIIALIPPILWGTGVWITFGDAWPTTWQSALELSHSGWRSEAREYWTYLADQIVGPNLPWIGVLSALGLVGLFTLRSAPPLTWAGMTLGLGCLILHGSLHLSLGSWWWLVLGPMLGLCTLAASGLAWLLAPGRPIPTRVLGLLLGLAAIGTQWGGHWRYADRDLLRMENQTWEEAGEWLRDNTGAGARIATTQPGSLLWHLGVTQRLAVKRVQALDGPLLEDRLRGIDLPARLDRVDPEYLVLNTLRDPVMVNALSSNLDRLNTWQQIHHISDGRGHFLIIYGRRGPEQVPIPPYALVPNPAAVARANEILARATESPSGWVPSEEETLGRSDAGVTLNGEGDDGYAWLPWLSVPSGAVEALEITLQVKSDAPVETTWLQVHWKGDDELGEALTRIEHCDIPVENSWGLQTIRISLSDNPLWRCIPVIRRLRVDPAPWPHRATFASITLIPVSAEESSF